jgi:membrane carboxypeptidase/penicillin-binding protein PbpC
MKAVLKKYSSLLKTLGFMIMLSVLIIALLKTQSPKEKRTEITYSIEVVKENGNWLYKVYRDDLLYIKQEYVPAVYGKQRFASKNDANQVAQLVLNKLGKQELPLITKEELITCKITFQPL